MLNRTTLSRLVMMAVLVSISRFAAAGTTILIDTRTADLPPGSRVRIEATAEYHLLEFAPVKADERGRSVVTRTAGEQNVKFRLPAQAPLVWEFVVPANGTVAPKQFRLTFPKDLAAPPKGMAGTMVFPMKYTISIPTVNGNPARTTKQTSKASMRIPTDGRWNRCLRVENWGQTGIFVGLTPDCTHDLRNDRRGSTSRAQ